MATFNRAHCLELLTALRGGGKVQIRYTKNITKASIKSDFDPKKFKTFPDAEAAVEFADRMNGVCNLYFVVGKQLTDNKSKADIASANAFWIDLDIREEKGYSSYNQAYESLKGLQIAANLHDPMIVYTGGGIHAYWLIDNEVPNEDWTRVSKLLRKAISKYGDKAMLDDTARVTDISSIMRLAGTYNIKREQDSYIVERAEAVPLSTFEEALSRYCDTYADIPEPKATNSISASAFNDIFKVSALPAYMVGKSTVDNKVPKPDTDTNQKPVYAQLLINCPLLMYYAENPDIPEVTWKNALNCIALCEDAAEAAHEFSSPYSGYDRDETTQKLNNAIRHGKSTLCATFIDSASTNVTSLCLCSTCPNYRSAATHSPLKGATKHTLPPNPNGIDSLSLAKKALDLRAMLDMSKAITSAVAAPKTNVPKLLILNPATNEVDLGLSEIVPDAPIGYTYGNSATGLSGVFDLSDVSTPLTPDLIWANPQRIESVTMPRTIQYQIMHVDTRGHKYEHTLLSAELEPKALAKWLMQRGMSTTADAPLVRFVQECADKARVARTPPAYLVDNYGWYSLGGQTLFATPSAVVGAGASLHTVVVRDRESGLLKRASDLGVTSNLEAWCDGFRGAFPNVPYASWAVLASLASALFYILRNDNYGMQAILVVFFGTTGTGKTYITKVCQSVWADPDASMVAGNSTTAAMQKLCVAARHTPLVIDDLTIPPDGTDNLRQFILYVPQGVEKSRSSAHNTLEASGRWNNTVFISTNLCLSDILLTGGDAGSGATARFVEINLPKLDTSVTPEDRELYGNLMFANHGVLGIEFVKRLMEKTPDEIKASFAELDSALIAALTSLEVSDTDMAARRFRRKLVAMTALVGDMMKDVLPFDPQEAITWAIDSIANGAFSANTTSTLNMTSRAAALKHLANFVLNRSASIYKCVAGNNDSEYVKYHLEQPNVDTSLEFEPPPRSVNLNRLHGSLEYATAHNQVLRDARVPVTIVQLIDWKCQPMGYYVNTTALNAEKLAHLGRTTQSLAIALGDVPDGSQRLQRFAMPQTVLGRGIRIPAEYLFVLEEEIQSA